MEVSLEARTHINDISWFSENLGIYMCTLFFQQLSLNQMGMEEELEANARAGIAVLGFYIPFFLPHSESNNILTESASKEEWRRCRVGLGLDFLPVFTIPENQTPLLNVRTSRPNVTSFRDVLSPLAWL